MKIKGHITLTAALLGVVSDRISVEIQGHDTRVLRVYCY
jgi:hypothetical protein